MRNSTALLAMLILASPAVALADDPEPPEAAAPAADPPEDPAGPSSSPDGDPAAAAADVPASAEVSGADNIEDVGIEDLLDMDLGDQLGTTESASRVKESVLQAPATITTLDNQRIRQSGAVTIPDLLRLVPGMQVYRNSAGNYVVSLRGMGGLSGNNLIVLVDGVSVNNPLDASVDWDLIPIDVADIDRLEVVAGPVSTIYGANAYTGVINIVSRKVIGESPSWGARARGGLDTGLGGAGSVSGRYLYHLGKTEANAFGSLSYDALSNEADSAAPALKSGGVAFRYGRKVRKTTSLALSGAASTSSRSSLEHLVLESIEQRKNLAMIGAKLTETDLPSLLDSISLWAQNITQQTTTDASLYDGLSYADTLSNRATAGVDLTLTLAANLTGKLSGQVSADWVDAPYIHPNENDQVRIGSGFGGGLKATPFKGLDLSAEARGDASPMTGKIELSYRANAVYYKERWALRVTAASAYRAPSWVEVGGRFTDSRFGFILLEGDPDIESPRNSSVEATATVSPNYDLTLRATGYYSRFTNVIVEDFEPVVRKTFRNSEDPRSLIGGELEGKLRLRESLWVTGAGSLLVWLDDDLEVATVATPEQNSALVVSAGLHGATKSERLAFGADAALSTERSYSLFAGIPPDIIDLTIPTSVMITAMTEYRLWPDKNLWASARLFSLLPVDDVESPLPNATTSAPGFLVGLEMRTE